MRIALPVGASLVYLAGYHLPGRELYEAREKLKIANRHTGHIRDAGDSIVDHTRAKKRLAVAEAKLAHREADHQKTLSALARTLRVYEAAYQKEHGVGTKPPGISPSNLPSITRQFTVPEGYAVPAND